MISLSAGVTQTLPPPVPSENVALLLSFDGADEATTTVDSSVYAHTITNHGAVKLDDAQKKFGSTSSYFGASGAYWSAPSSVAFELIDSDFTLECWVYIPVELTSSHEIMTFTSSDTYKKYFYLLGRRLAYLDLKGNVGDISSNALEKIVTATWTHIAWVRKNGNLSMYINGQRVLNIAIPTWGIGVSATIGCANFFNNLVYIDELRLVNGNALYDGAAISVPTEAFPIPEALPFEEETIAYFKMNGTDGSTTLTDSSTYGRQLTINGTVALETDAYKFGGSSLYFSTLYTNKSITTPWDLELEFLGNTTLRFHIRLVDLTRDCKLFSTRSPGSYNGWTLEYDGGNNYLRFETLIEPGSNPIVMQSANNIFSANTWYHIEINRFNNAYYMFIDGILKLSDVDSRYEYDSTARDLEWFVSDGEFYIDCLQMTHDGLPHTSNFTPPVAEY